MVFDEREEVLSLGHADPEFQQYLAQLAANNEEAPSLAAPKTSASPEGETLEIPMRDGYMSQLRVHKPKEPLPRGPGPAVVLIYGGGFVEGDNNQLTRYGKAINALYGITVINISYRLAPAHKFPAAPNDAWDSLKWIASHQKRLEVDLDAGFIIGGISAGGTLSAVCSQKWVTEKCSPPITGALLMIPMLFDKETVPEKYRHLWLAPEQNAHVPLFDGESVKIAMKAYDPDYKSPKFSPFNADKPHRGLPPTYIAVSGMDPLRDDGLIYHRVLEEHDVKTRLEVYPGVPHGHAIITHLKSAQKFFKDFLLAVGWILGSEKSDKEAYRAMLA